MQPPSILKATTVATKIDEKPRFARANQSLRASANGDKASQSAHGEGNNERVPSILVWNPTSQIPQLVNIDTVCKLLALKRSAVYSLVAKGLLDPPCKLSPGRRGASRFLLSSVLDFIQRLAAQRTLQPTIIPATSDADELLHPVTLVKTVDTPKKTRQVHLLPRSAGGSMT